MGVRRSGGGGVDRKSLQMEREGAVCPIHLETRDLPLALSAPLSPPPLPGGACELRLLPTVDPARPVP